jgi:hypothetical protein
MTKNEPEEESHMERTYKKIEIVGIASTNFLFRTETANRKTPYWTAIPAESAYRTQGG